MHFTFHGHGVLASACSLIAPGLPGILTLYDAIKPERVTRCGISELEWAARRDKIRHRGPRQQIGRGMDFVNETRRGRDIERERAVPVH